MHKLCKVATHKRNVCINILKHQGTDKKPYDYKANQRKVQNNLKTESKSRLNKMCRLSKEKETKDAV